MTVMEYQFCRWQLICSNCCNFNPIAFPQLWTNKTNYRFPHVCTYMSMIMIATCGVGSAFPSRAAEINPSFGFGFCCKGFSFYVVFRALLYNCLIFSFFFFPLNCILIWQSKLNISIKSIGNKSDLSLSFIRFSC